MKSKGEKQLEELVTSVVEVQTELSRLRGIETAAKALLDDLYINAASGINCSRQAKALALASGWTPSLRKADPAPPASPTGTLITNFADLRAGDKVRIEGKHCGTQVATLDVLHPVAVRAFPYWIMMVHTEDKLSNCLDGDNSFKYLRVYLLKRKPYVKDGRWVARAGDRFEGKGFWAGIQATVMSVDGDSYTLNEGNGAGHALLEPNWTPVEDT